MIGMRKLYWMLAQEFSSEHICQGVFHVFQTYGLFIAFLIFSVSQFVGTENSSEIALPFYGFLLYGVSLLFASLDQQSLFWEDLSSGYLSWLKVHGQNLRTYFFSKIISRIVILGIPLIGMIYLFFLSLGAPHYSATYYLCLALSLSIVICWGSLLGVLFGKVSHRGTSSIFFMGFLLLPLMIPTILVGVECMKALVMGQFCGYYLGMQVGLFVMTFSLCLILAPFILNQVE